MEIQNLAAEIYTLFTGKKAPSSLSNRKVFELFYNHSVWSRTELIALRWLAYRQDFSKSHVEDRTLAHDFEEFYQACSSLRSEQVEIDMDMGVDDEEICLTIRFREDGLVTTNHYRF